MENNFYQAPRAKFYFIEKKWWKNNDQFVALNQLNIAVNVAGKQVAYSILRNYKSLFH